MKIFSGLSNINRRSYASPVAANDNAQLDGTRAQVKELDFHPMNPFVATVAGSFAAKRAKVPEGQTSVRVSVPEYYAEPVTVHLGLHQGPNAKMMLILPGIYGDAKADHAQLFKKKALDQGMNYAVLSNSCSSEMLAKDPHFHPGNPRVDAMATRKILENLCGSFPSFFSIVSVAGYSYGGLHAANLVRHDEEHEQQLVNGNLVAISPPVNYANSMQRLDGLRQNYTGSFPTLIKTALKYRSQVGKHGYENFLKSKLAARQDTGLTSEVHMSDEHGSRQGLQNLVQWVDRKFGHNRLPKHSPDFQDASRRTRNKEHRNAVRDITYAQLNDNWFSQDSWLAQSGMDLQKLSDDYSLTEAVAKIQDTPSLILASADDYILAEKDVQALRDLENDPRPNCVIRVFDHGGHVGLDWNPQVAQTFARFAAADIPRARTASA